MTAICLGCGQPYPTAAYCPDCERKAVRVIEQSHWPLETSLSLAALMVIETAVRSLIPANYEATPELDTELENLANVIRAHLQHVLRAPIAKPAPVTPAPDDWLG